MIREAFRGAVGFLGWLFMLFGPFIVINSGPGDLGARILAGTVFFLPGLILVAICRRVKKRQRDAGQQKRDASPHVEKEHTRAAHERHQRQDERYRAEQVARRNSEEKRREEEQRRRAEEDHRARSSQKPIRDEKYYASILGLNNSGRIESADVKRKYRELAQQYHPDKVNHLGPKLREVAEREMKAINEAYDFFKREYDI